MFDRNGDGSITKKELSDSLRNLGINVPDAELQSMIDNIDTNGDGCVDMEEFGALYQTIMDEHDDADEEDDMREPSRSSTRTGTGRTVDDCRRMIRKVDVDGDGMVNYKEFKQMMRGGGFAALT
ncbi:hypothetical protein HPP92_005522 [Vanilla planifolia]|uniref:EF-hand domain-containing protein n=1 Tax=Vanilla planifolia TaxID=51239 RepID=A0A835RIS2_VANPL|nr:hypothetical protein HPP92_005522 [Vanilla planifolia]